MVPNYFCGGSPGRYAAWMEYDPRKPPGHRQITGADGILVQLFRRLKPGRAKPFAHMRAGLRLAGLPQGIFPGRPRLHDLGFLAQSDGFGREAIFQKVGLFETSPLDHGTLISMGGRRERNRAFSSRIAAGVRSVMDH